MVWALLFVLAPKEKEVIYLREGVFRESINTVNYRENVNERMVKVTLSSAVQTSSLLAKSQAGWEHQEQRLQMFCLLNRKH